jgi:hypothetical protein
VHEVVVRHVALNRPTRGPAGREGGGGGREGCRLWTFKGVRALSTKCRGMRNEHVLMPRDGLQKNYCSLGAIKIVQP